MADSPSQSQTFTCSKCGAPQDYQGGSAPTIQCPYCDTTLIVPEALRTGAPNLAAFSASEWTREAEQLVEIKRLVDAGKKIEAIKLYRETFGTGLKESKDAVEAIERGQNIQVAQITFGTPQTINVNQDGSGITLTPTSGGGVQISSGQSRGCMTWVIVIVVLAVIAAVILPVLLSVGAFALFMPTSNESARIVTILTDVPRASPTARATETARPSPTPQFANVVSEFGGSGTGAGKMEDARAIAVDNNGQIFVAEYLGGRVQIFDTDGKFKTQCLMDKAPLPSLAADRSGNLYVLQRTTIFKYNAATCEKIDEFKPALGENYESIAVGADGNLYATMTGNLKDSVVRLNSSGRATVVVDSAISGQRDNFELNPILAVDGQGNFYVLGTFASQVFKFDRSGKFIDSIGSEGNEPGQFRGADALAIDSQGRLYVSDSKGVQVFTPDGRFIDVFDIPKSVASGMAFDDQDNLWIAAREQVYQMRIAK